MNRAERRRREHKLGRTGKLAKSEAVRIDREGLVKLVDLFQTFIKTQGKENPNGENNPLFSEGQLTRLNELVDICNHSKLAQAPQLSVLWKRMEENCEKQSAREFYGYFMDTLIKAPTPNTFFIVSIMAFPILHKKLGEGK